MKKLLIVFMLLALPALSQSDDDKIWRVRTDQLAGFYMVKFSNNDSIIVGHGYQKAMFYRASDGEEIARLPFNAEVHFIENDNKFIQLAPSQDRLIIFDTKSLEPIDTLEFDERQIGDIDISRNELFVVGAITGGFRIWDLISGKILRSKIYEISENLLGQDYRRIIFNCDNSRIIGQATKYYKNPDDPDQTIYTGCFEMYDFETLDSIQCLGSSNSFRLSNTCQYIAFKVGVKDFGVEIYRYPSMELIQRLPLNGNSLTGMEFSPDDKYLVTSPTITIWNVETREKIYGYISGTANNIDVCKSGKYLTSSIGRYLYLWKAKWDPSSISPDFVIEEFSIAPNPTLGQSELRFYKVNPDFLDISLTNISGNTIKKIFSEHISQGEYKISIDLNDQSPGVYFINIKASHYTKSFKIVVER